MKCHTAHLSFWVGQSLDIYYLWSDGVKPLALFYCYTFVAKMSFTYEAKKML